MKQSLCAHVKSLGRWLECCQCHRVPMSMESLGMALSWGSHTYPTDTHPTDTQSPEHSTFPPTHRQNPTHRAHALHTGITAYLTPVPAAKFLWSSSSSSIPLPGISHAPPCVPYPHNPSIMQL